MNAIQTPGYQIEFPNYAVPMTIKGEPIQELAVRVEEDLLKCMKNCLKYEPKRRATIPMLLEDPFLRNGNDARANCTSSKGGGREEDENTITTAALDPQIVIQVIQKTLQWSQGRLPSRGEQERFTEAIMRQVQQIQSQDTLG